MTTDVASAGRRLQTRLFAGALVTVVAATGTGAWIAHDRAGRAADDRIAAAADAAASALEDEVDGLAGALAGVGGIATDGALDLVAFRSFGDGVVERQVAREVVLMTVDGGGTIGAAVRLDRSGSIVDTALAPSLRAALGRATPDGDAVAARTAEPDGESALTVARAVTDPAGELVGFVALVIDDERISAVLDDALPDGVRPLVSMDEVVLLGEPFERTERTAAATASLADRSWLVTVGPRAAEDLAVLWAVLAAGAAALIGVVALTVVTGRRQGRLLAANKELRVGREGDRAAQVVVGQLARAITGAEVFLALRDLLPRAVGARTATVGLVTGDGMLEISTDAVEGRPDAGERIALPGSESAVHRAVVDGEAAWMSSPLAWRDDDAVDALVRGGNAAALLPLDSGDVRGVLAVSYARFHVFDPGEQQVLATVAVLAAQALNRGRRYDAEHEAAVAFQRAALPDALPTVPGLSVTARYRPAAKQVAVGGDWYDVIDLDGQRTFVVVGDVVGHGMEAALAMGRLRTALRVIVALDPDPGMVLDRLSQQVDAIPDAFCATVLCAVIDRRERTVTWSRAGHLPPLLLTASDSELLDDRCAPPLGVTDAPVPVHTRTLASSDRLVLFTDGIVERRDEDIDAGLDRLAVMARSLADLDESEFTDTLVEAIVPHERQVDDIAILVVAFDDRRDTPAVERTTATPAGR